MVSTVKKPQATIPAACWCRNARQVVASRRGAGLSPWRRRVVRRHCCVCGERARSRQTVRHESPSPCPAPIAGSAFAGFCFPSDVIVLAVRWYLRFGLSYRDVEELLAERGVDVDHVTIYRWVQRFTRCWRLTPPGPAAMPSATAGRWTRPM